MSDDTIYRKDAINLCEKWKNRTNEHHDKNGWYIADTLLKDIKELPSADRPIVVRVRTIMKKEDYDNLKKGIKQQNPNVIVIPHNAELVKPTDKPQGEWIPCSKKMPNEGDRIVVQYADGSLGLINSCSMRIWNLSNSPYSKVVAWMYIEPWKGADDEDD